MKGLVLRLAFMGSIAIFGASAAFGQTSAGPCSLTGDLPADPPLGCADAIAAAPDPGSKAVLLLRYAYSLNEQNKAVAALAILDRAVALAPRDAQIRHERVYTLNDLGFCRRALDDSDVEIMLTPDRLETYQERAFTHECLGDFSNAVVDTSKQITLGSGGPETLIARARALQWLGRYDDAEADLTEAQALAKDDAKTARHTAVVRARSLRLRDAAGGKANANRCEMTKSMDKQSTPKSLIADCTAAYLAAGTSAEKAEALTTRSTAWLLLDEDQDSATEDLKVAAGIDADNPSTHINYGYRLLQWRHSWAARNEFDLALARNRHWLALAGRGQANFNLGDKAAALTDAKASFAIQPNEPAASLLGDLAFEGNDKTAARTFWLASYRLGARDDRLIEQLKSVGVTDPAAELAKDGAKR